MDLESVADELYGLPPEEFVEARGRRAAAARNAGDRALAGRITALRRPTLSAWASNHFVRSEPDRTAALLRLGESLRQAHQELDRDRIRELGAQRNRLVGALSRHVRERSAEAGRPLGDAAVREVESTLQAVLADPEAAEQWATGRLARPLTPPVGFTGAAVAGAARRPAADTAPAEGPGPGRKGKPEVATEAEGTGEPRSTGRRKASPRPAAAHDTRKDRPTDEARDESRRRERERNLAHARREADAAEHLARDVEDELRQTESAREAAEERLARTKEQAAALSAEVKRAQEQLRVLGVRLDDARAAVAPARAALDEARKRVTAAKRTAGRARRAARTAADRVRRLEADSP